MAFVDQQGGQGQQQQQEEPVVAAGGQGIGGTAGASVPGQNVPMQPSAQLSAYLNANAPQAEQFAGNIASDVGGKITQAGQAINPAAQQFQSNIYSVQPDAAVTSKVASAPSSLTAQEKAAYKTQLEAQSKSPNPAGTFETTQPYQQVSSGIQQAVEQADLWSRGNDVASLSTALTPYSAPTATKGAKTLDALLLSRTPGAYNQIQGAIAPAAGLEGQLGAATSQSNAALQNAISQNAAATQAANQAAGQYVGGLNSTLAQYLSQAQNDVNNYNQSRNAVAQNMANVQPQLAALQNAVAQYNSTLSGGPDTTGVGDLTSMFNQINLASQLGIPDVINPPSVAQVATPQQYSEIAALQELLGPAGLSSLNASISPEQAILAGNWQNTGGQIANISQLLDPVTSSAIQGLNPNWAAAQQFAPMVQGSSPLLQNLKDIDAAIAALTGSAARQPWVSNVQQSGGTSPSDPPSYTLPGGEVATGWEPGAQPVPGVTYGWVPDPADPSGYTWFPGPGDPTYPNTPPPGQTWGGGYRAI